MTNKLYREYQLQAEKYDKRWAKYLNHTHNRAIQFMSPSEHDLILDNSGGTGKFCEHLLEIPDTRVILTDFSEEMLNIAQNRFQALNNRFEAIHSDAYKLPFDSGIFDKVYNLNSFHFYDYPDAVLKEMFRVCKPGGQVLIQDWSSDTLIFRVFVQFLRLNRKPVGTIYSQNELEKLVFNHTQNIELSTRWTWKYWSFTAIRAVKT
jgi:ubiquinone/menaquinone biosynthesis C-methylase UbiE